MKGQREIDMISCVSAQCYTKKHSEYLAYLKLVSQMFRPNGWLLSFSLFDFYSTWLTSYRESRGLYVRNAQEALLRYTNFSFLHEND